MTRERWLSPLDRALLEAIATEGTVVGACRALRIGRDRGVYRLRRLTELAGRPLVRADRGGAGRGRTRLTTFGERLRRSPTGPIDPGPPGTGRLRGRYSGRGGPHLRLPGGLDLAVGFEAAEDAPVEVALDPEAVLLARERFPSSARNVLEGTVERVEARDRWTRTVRVLVGRLRFSAALTPRAIAELGLGPGARTYLYIKATALRPVAELAPVRP